MDARVCRDDRGEYAAAHAYDHRMRLQFYDVVKKLNLGNTRQVDGTIRTRVLF